MKSFPVLLHLTLTKNIGLVHIPNPKNLRCWKEKEPTEDTCMYFSTVPQDDVDGVSNIQLKDYGVAGGVAGIQSSEFPGAHLVKPVLHQDGSGSVAAVAKCHE